MQTKEQIENEKRCIELCKVNIESDKEQMLIYYSDIHFQKEPSTSIKACFNASKDDVEKRKNIVNGFMYERQKNKDFDMNLYIIYKTIESMKARQIELEKMNAAVASTPATDVATPVESLAAATPADETDFDIF